MFKRFLLAILLPIPVAIAAVSCDSAPPLGSYGPPVPVIRDLSGVDFPVACWVVAGQYPCYDLGPADGGTD